MNSLAGKVSESTLGIPEPPTQDIDNLQGYLRVADKEIQEGFSLDSQYSGSGYCLCRSRIGPVFENGDLANWSMSDNDSAPAVGGAMDLAVGARQVWVMMEHQTKSGASRLVRRCSYPLTAGGVVKRVYTNLAVLDVTSEGFAVRDMVEGLTLDALQKVTDAPLRALAR